MKVEFPTFAIVAQFHPGWNLAWRIADHLKWTRVKKLLEDHPWLVPKRAIAGAPRPYRYATRSYGSKDGGIRWSLYSDPGTEPVDECWPDVKA